MGRQCLWVRTTKWGKLEEERLWVEGQGVPPIPSPSPSATSLSSQSSATRVPWSQARLGCLVAQTQTPTPTFTSSPPQYQRSSRMWPWPPFPPHILEPSFFLHTAIPPRLLIFSWTSALILSSQRHQLPSPTQYTSQCITEIPNTLYHPGFPSMLIRRSFAISIYLSSSLSLHLGIIALVKECVA